MTVLNTKSMTPITTARRRLPTSTATVVLKSCGTVDHSTFSRHSVAEDFHHDRSRSSIARVAGLEPATCGFGDRCSTS